MRRAQREVAALALVVALGAVLAFGLAGTQTGAREGSDLRSYFAAHGAQETGSINLVSAIYLGYRALDTLGETLILFLAVTGVMLLRGGGR